MGYLTLGILGFTALALLFGALVGCLRGANRAALRLGLLLLTVLLAFLLRSTVYDAAVELEFSLRGETMSISTLITDAIADALGEDAPEAIHDLAFALAEILIGLAAFFVLFIVLRLFTWLILFPILKLFVKKGQKRRRGVGALVGLLQGALVAFVICAPITGLLVQTDKLSQVKMQGETLFEVPEELGLGEYLASAPGKVYIGSGTWFFTLLTSTESASGTKVTIEDACDVLSASSAIMDKATSLGESLSSITGEGATTEERIDAIRDVGDALIEIGSSLDDLSGDAKDLAEELIGSLASSFAGEGSEIPPEFATVLEDLDFDEMDLAAAGGAMNAIANTIESDGSTPLSESDASAIVNGVSQNAFLLDMIAPEGEEPPTLIELSGDDAETVESALASSSLSSEQKDVLRALLGMS